MRSSRLSGFFAAAFLAAISSPLNAEPSGDIGKPPVWRYTVKPGDTLITVANRYLVRPDEWPKIQKNNQIADPYRILPGTRLSIPASMLRQAPGAARLEKISGQVSWHSGDGKWQIASDGISLSAGAAVKTLGDSSALLELADGSRIVIAPSSTLVLDVLSVYAGGLMADTRLHLPEGQADIAVTPQQGLQQQNLRVRTPSAQAVVRGTRFRVEADAASTREETLSGLVGVAAAGRSLAVPVDKGTVVKDGQPPMRPIALLPAANVSGLPTRFEHLPMRFDLPQLPGAVEWEGLVATDRQLQSILSSKRTRSNYLTFADLPNGNYVLALRAIDVNGLRGRDALHSFTVFARPFPPGLNTPGDGAVIRTARPTFVWGNVVDAARYRFQVATDAQFTAPIHDAVENTEKASLPVDLPPGPLFWRAATFSGTGEQGPWSRVAAFTYKPGPGPADLGKSALTVDREHLTLTLPAQPGMRYEAVLAADKNLQPVLAQGQSEEGSLKLLSPDSGTYFLGVRLVDLTDGTPGPWSIQTVDIPVDGRVWLLLLPLVLLF